MTNYIYLKISGININRFLLKCNKASINIYKIKNKSYKSVIVLIKESDYEKVLKYKGIYKIELINKIGLNKIKDQIKIYKYLLISFIFGIIFLLILCNTIFDIEIISDNKELKNKIKNELYYYGIKKYSFKKNYNEISIIKKNIKKKYKNNIEWIEIKQNGIKVIVNLVERKVESKNKDDSIYSIVAKRSGVIRKIFTENGVSLVEVGNYVNKGDVLISSDLILNEEIKNRVPANGKVYAETWYKVYISYPLEYNEIIFTNKDKKNIFIKIGNNYYELFKYKNYSRDIIFSYKNNMNNIEIGLENIKEKKIINKKYSLKEAKKMAIKEAKNKMKVKLNNDEYIISQKALNFSNNGSKIEMEIFFSVYEEIGEKKVIEMGENNDSEHFGDGVQ